MNQTVFQTQLKQLQRQQEQLIKRRNRPQKNGNGIFDRYEFPVADRRTYALVLAL